MEDKKIALYDVEPPFNPTSEELAKVIVYRLGLIPAKSDAKASKMHRLLIELYERRKIANQKKKPHLALMTVDEMALFAGIKKPTMYEYLGRWLKIGLIKKASFVNENREVVRGYVLNGNTLEEAFQRVKTFFEYYLEKTQRIISEFQRLRKNEKIKETMSSKGENG